MCSISRQKVVWFICWPQTRIRCMGAHSSDMQDPSQHMILRYLHDTTFPFHHHHYSSITLGITLDSSSSCLKDAEGLIPAYMHLPGITSSIHCCMVALSSDMQDPSWCTILRHPWTVHNHYLHTNTPLFLNALHWTCHYHALMMLMDSYRIHAPPRHYLLYTP
jgi:hypothetical protein